ncbi:cobalamin-binding protein [Marinobacterium mangrovicola]|uniref:Iron complex transport system substrate-binding protein n=1 Tax=Marinobacterium mangrovicola TaxID=1476959 RepID=A0A4R1GFW2_9GAMM|nr:cobalamin-binding protein [Marinobacterium mangrovicola]TCK07327.1 iron complex transport system substrate-binding protein [Marinobacterium mangrovicola]
MARVVVFLLFLLPGLLQAEVLTDASGKALDLEQPVKRIVVLAPNIAENLYAIGAGERIVGRVAHTDYPPEVIEQPQVGDYQQFNVEAILALQPDLVLAWQQGNPEQRLRRLEAMGLRVFRLSSGTLDEIPYNLELLGRLTGREPEAGRAARNFRERLAELEPNLDRRPRVFYQLWNDPLLSVSRGTLIGEAIEFCGAENVFAERPETIPQLNLEAVIAARPDLIIATDELEQSWRERWLPWQQIPAVAKGRLVTLDADLMHRAAPRFLDGVAALCRAVSEVREDG